MKKLNLVLLLVVMSIQLYAAETRVMSYQGLLTDAKQQIVADSIYSITFAIYDVPNGGTALWVETQSVRTVKGVFDANLGSVNPINLSFNTQYYLGVQLQGSSEMIPRLVLGASAYTLRAEQATVAESVSPSASGVVRSLNALHGDLILKGSGSTLVSVQRDTIDIFTQPSGLTEIRSADVALQVTSPQGPIVSLQLKDSSVSLQKLAPGVVPVSLPPSGIASGDLSGLYPAPQVANGVITNEKLATAAVTTAKLEDLSVTTLKLSDSSVTDRKIAHGISYAKLSGAPTSLPPSGAASGDLSGSYPAPVVAAGAITSTKLADDAVSTAKILDANVTSSKLADNAVTTAKITDAHVTSSKLADTAVTDSKIAHGISYAKLSGAPASLPPSGAASGDLSGSYPAPVVAAGAITSTKLADDAVSTVKILDANVTTSKLADNAVTTAKIADAHVTNSKLADTAVTDSKIAHGISYAKLSGAPTTLPPSGTASGDLSGSYPAPVVAAGAITNTKLADDAVSTAKILDANVTTSKLADNAVTTPKILDANVTTSKLADNAVTTTKIADAHVTNSKLADTAVTDSKIAHGISYAKLSGVPASLPPSGAASGDLSGSYPAPVVAAGAITNTKLADDAVSTAKILDANVTTSKLADNAVTTPKILDANVTTSKLADNAVTTTKIADAHVTNSKLADTAVTDSKIAHGISYVKLSGVPASLPPSGAASGDLSGSYPAPVVAAGAITNTKLADDAVSTAKILDANVTSSKLADNAVTTPKILDANVTTSKLADNAVTTAKITDAHVTSSKLADTAVTDSKIAHGISYAKLSGAPTTLPPSGAASGDLSGSYPAPVVAAGAITSTKLADDAVSTAKILDANVTTSKLADNAVTTAKITDAHVTSSKLADTAVTDSKIAHGISYAKLSGAPTTLPPSGAASGDLSGSYPAPVVAAGAITNTKLADDAVSTAKILDANVTTSKLADNAVTTPKILDANVTTSKLADNAVTTTKIADAHVTNSKLADTAVTDSKIAHGISYAKLSGAPTSLPPSGAASGDLSGSYPAPVVAAGAITNTKLADDAVSTAKILDANVTTSKLADNAVTTAKIADAHVTNSKLADTAVTDSKIAHGISYVKLSGVPASLPPSGAASGDLSGSYPAPVVAAGAITNTKLADDAVSTAKILDANVTSSKLADNAVTTPKILDANVTTSKLADNAVTTAKITDAHVTSSKLADTAVTDSKIAHGISYAKLSGAPTTLPPSGAASGDLSGSYPAPVVAAGAITSTKLADDAVSTAKILDANVTSSKLADNAVTTPKILDANVTSSKLADNAVTTPKILDANVTSSKLADNAVTTAKITDAHVTNSKLADTAVTDSKIAHGISYAKLSGAPTTLPPSGAASGDLSGSYPAPVVAAGAITNTKLADDAVSTAKILDANVTSSKLADNAVTTPKILDANVTTSKLADNAVTTAKITDAHVTSSKLADTAVTDSKIAHGISYAKLSGAPTTLPPSGAASGDLSGSYPAPVVAAGAITNTKLADDAVSTAKILDANVTTSKLADNAVTTLKILDANVTTSKLADNAVTTPKILDANVTTSKLADNAVTTTKITDAHVTSSKLADTAVTNSKIAHGISYAKLSGAPTSLPPSGAASGDLSGSYPAPVVAVGAITNTKLADDAVSTTKILDVNVTTSKLADNAVNTSKLADGSVSTTKLADVAVTTVKVADASITNAKLADASVNDVKVASGISYAKLSGAPSSLPPNGPASGDLSGNYPAPTVGVGAITATKIANDAVTSAKIADANVTTAKLADEAITTAKLIDGSVTNVKLADAAVTDAKVSVGISYTKLSGAPLSLPPSGAASGDLSGTYPSPIVAANAITSSKIADANVTTVKLADAAVTMQKLHSGGASPGQVLQWNGSSWLPTTPTSMNYFSESRSTLPPNNSQPAHQFIVSGSDLAIDAVISPKGVGAFCLDLADNSSTGGAKRGLYAIDLQRVRNTASQVASGSYATILGGSNNTASGNYATIAGGASNSAGFCGTIGGGSGNTSNGNYSGSLSGVNNSAGGAGAVVAGGEQCNASAVRASITGGYGNTASLEGAHVGGGSFNAASNLNSVVAGGHFNVASNVRSAVGGGLSNTASGDGAVIAGGSYNISSGGVSAIIGGSNNLASGFASTVGGGTQDTASGTGSVVGGGQYCKASAGNSTVGGGSYNKATGLASTIAGGYNNEVFSSYASIGGGLSNVCSGIYATVAGGYGNAATVQSASVLGGEENWASGLYSGVFGGNSNSASGQHSYVLGGYNNTVATQFSSVLGGSNNASAAGAFHSVVLSGQLNEVSTGYSCILGGSSNTTSGHYNLVYGNGVTPTAAEPYRVYFFGGSASGMLSINRLDADYPIHVGTTSSDGNGAYLSAGGQWTDGSSRSFKDRYTTLDSADVLRKVKGLDLRGWWYKNTQEYHIGPFAEDFRENFGTGVLDNPSSSHYLSATDIAGVALYSSQQLIKSSEAQLARVAELEERVAKLESLLNSSDRRAISQGFAAQNVLPQTAPTEESAVRILSIVPDPASSQIVVHFRLEHSATVTLSIVSGTGELQQAVLTAMPMRSGSFEIDANIQNLASGWYLLNLESDTGAAQRLFRVLR